MVRFRDLQLEAQPGPPTVHRGAAAPSQPPAADVPAPSAVQGDGQTNGLPAAKGSPDTHKIALYERATLYLAEVLKAAQNQEPLDLAAGFHIMSQIVDVQTPQDVLFLKAIHSDESYRFVLHHSVNVAIYAVKLAQNLAFKRQQQIEVGMAGLLHEVGMAMISEEVIFKKNLSERDFHVFKERPVHGFNILRQAKAPYAYLAECALQVYERIDGSGYPRGLKGEEIHEYAQLIGLVDMYEALVHSRPQREKFLHYNAVKEILKNGKKSFQRRHIKALLELFSVFPLLSYVKLNSNAIGKVIATYPDQPMRPKLQMVVDSQKNMILTERIIDLPDNPLLHITEALSEEDLVAYCENTYFRDRPVTDNSGSEDDDDEPALNRRSATAPADQSQKGFRPRPIPTSLVVGGAAAGVVLLTLLWLFTQGRPRHLLEASTEQSPPAVTMPVVKPPMPDGPPVAAQPQAAGAASVSAADAPQAADTPPAPVPLPAAAKSVDAIQWAGESDDAAAAIAEPVHGRGATPAPLVAAETPSRSYPFSLLLGSYSSEDQARQAVQTHRANGLDSFWVKIDLGAKNIRYRVFGGYFETAEQAEEAAVRHRLSPGAVKATRYAIMVGQKADGHHAKALIQMLQDQGYCPYGIADQSGRVSVYLGAFYTLKGAQLHANEMALTQLEGLQVVKR